MSSCWMPSSLVVLQYDLDVNIEFLVIITLVPPKMPRAASRSIRGIGNS